MTDQQLTPSSDESPEEDMATLLEQSFMPRNYRRGEIAQGEVVRADEEGILVSLGLKTEGVVSPQEMRTLPPEERAALRTGDPIWVMVLGGRGGGEMLALSLDQAQRERSWKELKEFQNSGEEITARVTGYNKGGLEVDYKGMRGFVPFSQLAPMGREENRDAILGARVGANAQFQVLEVDPGKQRLILSERASWQRQREQARQEFMASLQEGMVLEGKVSSLRGFGAFVSLGSVEGLVHISEISWGMVKSPEDVLKVGDPVKVQVLKVDPESGRISLSIKRTMPEPWQTVPERYNVGDIVTGTVARLTDFGAFVSLESGVDGLVHISELSHRRVAHPKECVYEGQQIQVKILGIDAEHRRISLSYKQAHGMDEPPRRSAPTFDEFGDLIRDDDQER